MNCTCSLLGGIKCKAKDIFPLIFESLFILNAFFSASGNSIILQIISPILLNNPKLSVFNWLSNKHLKELQSKLTLFCLFCCVLFCFERQGRVAVKSRGWKITAHRPNMALELKVFSTNKHLQSDDKEHWSQFDWTVSWFGCMT